MLRRLYDWTMSLAARKSAEVWLAVIAFVESSVFLVPADVLFLPMALARPERAYRYALVATIASVLGGIAGWYIGHYAFEALAKPILHFYGKLEAFEAMKASVGYETLVLLLVTSGLAHLPPIKVVTILSGAANINLGLFIISAIIARGARFFLLAWLLQRYGEEIRDFIEKRLGLLAAAAAGVLIAVFAAYRSLPDIPMEPAVSASLTQSPRGLLPSVLATLGMTGTVGGALAFEHIGGYIPCALCLIQRTPYYWGIPIGIVAIATSVLKLPVWTTRALLVVIAILMLVGAGTGVYHAGVEWHFWEGPATCATSASGVSGNVGDLLGDLDSKHGPSCTDAALRVLGLSFAGWNVIASLILAAIALRGAAKA